MSENCSLLINKEDEMAGVIYIPFADPWTFDALIQHANTDERYGPEDDHEIQFVCVSPNELKKMLEEGKKGVGAYSARYARQQLNTVHRNVLLSTGELVSSGAPKGFDKIGVVWKLRENEDFSLISKSVESLLYEQTSDGSEYASSYGIDVYDRHHGLFR